MRMVATPEMVLETTGFVCDRLPRAADWEQPAGTLLWSCRQTLDHIGDGLLWYSTQLAARATGLVPSSRPDAWPDASVDELFVALPPLAAVLAEVARAAPADTRAWHGFGVSDPEGFCAMACAEQLVHGADIAQGLGVEWNPPAEIASAALGRLFPDVMLDDGDDVWTVLWHAHRDDPNWSWHAAPLE
jgi:hypothetical protein